MEISLTFKTVYDLLTLKLVWGSPKVGRLYGKRFANRRDAMEEIIDWLMIYDHPRLLHAGLCQPD